jgi:hypothetical protein
LVEDLVKRRLIFLVGICLVLGIAGLSSIRLVSNYLDYQRTLSSTESTKQYSFFVAGHTYGVPDVDNPGVHPPFKALFPQINSSHIDWGVFTGDIVIESTPTDWDEVDADLAALTPPVHFVVGNHDISDRDLFTSRYGPTYHSFEYGKDLFVILDTEFDPCNISGEQIQFLENTLSTSHAQNVFVFVHKLIWVTEDTPYYGLRHTLNSTEGYDFRSNFWSDVVPLFRALESQVYVIAGDVGVTWAMPLFYEQDGNIHLVASGMGGAEEENFLIFDVNPDNVQIRAQRLDGQPLNQDTVDAYNLEYYSSLR